MEVGAAVVLNISDCRGCSTQSRLCISGVIAAKKPHHDDIGRYLYFFVCKRVEPTRLVAAEDIVDDGDETCAADMGEGSFTSPQTSQASTAERRMGDSQSPQSSQATPIVGVTTGLSASSVARSRFSKKGHQECISSPEGYMYRFDGWYDELSLLVAEGTVDWMNVPTPDSATTGSHHDGGQLPSASSPLLTPDVTKKISHDLPCELEYLGLSMKPWFYPPFDTVGSLVPIDNMKFAFTVYICHRCLTPFNTILSLVAHQDVFCNVRLPPGVLLYRKGRPPHFKRDEELRVYCVDGAKELRYGRNLAMLSRCFVESKVLTNDVDIYEFFVVTVGRAVVARWAEGFPQSDYDNDPSNGMYGESGLATFDADRWEGDVVVGFFCRMKQTPDHALSCIVTFAAFQSRGLGNLMLDVAYHMTYVRQRFCGCAKYCGKGGGGISRPLSFGGEKLLLRYWRSKIFPFLLAAAKEDGERSDDSDETLATYQLGTALGSPSAVRSFTLDSFRETCAMRLLLPITEDDMQFFLDEHGMMFYHTPSSTATPRGLLFASREDCEGVARLEAERRRITDPMACRTMEDKESYLMVFDPECFVVEANPHAAEAKANSSLPAREPFCPATAALTRLATFVKEYQHY